MPRNLGLHETLELHELLTFKNTCLTKSSSMSALAKDGMLQEILEQDISQSKQAIQQLQNFVSHNGGQYNE
jgi:similar to spore coat protein